jgi:hypothetical protein
MMIRWECFQARFESLQASIRILGGYFCFSGNHIQHFVIENVPTTIRPTSVGQDLIKRHLTRPRTEVSVLLVLISFLKKYQVCILQNIVRTFLVENHGKDIRVQSPLTGNHFHHERVVLTLIAT